jgi:hypothetical protein
MQAEEPSDGCARVIVPCFLQDERCQHGRAAANEDKDGNGYLLFVCPEVKSLLDTDLGMSLLYLWLCVVFDIYGYL